MTSLKTHTTFGKFSLYKFRKLTSNYCGQKRILLLTLLLALSSMGWSQKLAPDQLEATNKKITLSIDLISKQLDEDKIPYDSLNVRLQTLFSYRDSVTNESRSLQKAIDFANISLTALGDPPAEGQPKEPDNVAQKRKDLTNQIKRLTGISKSADLLSSDLDKLIDQISSVRATHFFSGLTNRSTSPFSKELWVGAAKEFKVAIKMLVDHLSTFWQQAKNTKKDSNLIFVLFSIVFAIGILLIPWTSSGQRLANTFKKTPPPSDIKNGLRLVSKPTARCFLALIAGGVLYWTAMEVGLFSPEGKQLAKRIWLGAVILVFIWYYAKNLIAPGQVIWNTLTCVPGKENQCRFLFKGIFAIFIIDRILSAGFGMADVGIKLVMAQAVITSSLFAIFLWFFLKPKLWLTINTSGQKPDSSTIPPNTTNSFDASEDTHTLAIEIIDFLVRAFAILVLAGIIFEYIRFSNFVFHRFVLMFLFLIFMYTLRILALWALAQIPYTKLYQITDDSSTDSSNKNENKKVDQNPDEQQSVNFWLKSALNLNLFVLGIPAFLIVIGFDWVDVKHWMHVLTSGFKIGAITISFRNIAYGVMIFLFINIITRWITGTINKRLTKYTHMDAGVLNSMITLINYFGVFIALVAALPILGVKFSQIAMIAGALSVGIGFGLQNIVNDFVSGIILLIERPIKIGDWVVVQSGQGYVSSIRLRVTLIQTFDRAIIVIPNSELVSSAVQNWFYNGKQGRVKIAVNVDYGSDPQKVKDILLQCANEHPSILYHPVPFVAWDDFGDYALNFIVYGYIKNYDSSLTTKTELRFQIFNKLKEAGISIPFPQRDIHIKNDNDLTITPPTIEDPISSSKSSPQKEDLQTKEDTNLKDSIAKKEEDKKEDKTD